MLGLVRANISIRHTFREVSPGYTLVMTHAFVDPCGSVPSWMSDMSSLPQLISVSKAGACAESANLSLHLMADTSSKSV